MRQLGKRVANKMPVPRSSSPVSVYVELPSIVDQAFSTISWDDLEGCSSESRPDSLISQTNESDPDDQFLGECALDLIADAAILESNLSPADLIQFQGCIIPPLTPQRQQEISTETGNFHAEDGALYWENMADCHGQALGKAMVVNNELHQTFHKQQEELECLEERNLHLKELASRAKHLALVLEKLMTVRELHVEEAVAPCVDAPQGSSKRQRLNEETDSSDSVEDMLRDISSRCNAVLLSSSTAPRPQQSEAIRVFGSFSGIQMSTFSSAEDGAQAEECVSSFKTSIREHGTIRTTVFPHGHTFTSKTQQGGYRFRWVPNHS
ncbi:hypothetical protein OJAV_G00087090 [Oryzias javanicus]|uniref:Multicilin n=1 Tax=Oryzias javanicus TaxID=123683 RepID=A0A3S2P6R2_ORYJA|nr:hypothetical protein OJAV_G00087090 [Oryzias javanicus]